MATSVRYACMSRPFQSIFAKQRLLVLNHYSTARNKLQFRNQSNWNNNGFQNKNAKKYVVYGLTAGIATVGTVAVASKYLTQPVAAETGKPPQITPSRSVSKGANYFFQKHFFYLRKYSFYRECHK